MPINSRGSAKAEVRAVIDAIADAVRAKDVEAMISHCAPEIATFDLVPPLKHEGADALRELWAKTLAAFVPPLEYEVHELDLVVGRDVAFSRSVNRFGGTRSDGKRIVNWLCSTIGLRKIDFQWKVVHEHVSVPFDMETGKALLKLEPPPEARSH
jgi:ketosteroid isomerase-like protein